jgi:hypothetical protein
MFVSAGARQRQMVSRKSGAPISTFPSSVNWRRRSFRSGDALEAGSLEVVRLNAALGGGPLGQEALEDATRDTDRAGVLPDLDPELHGLPLGIPAGVRGVHPFALSAPDEVPQGMQQTKRLGVVLDRQSVRAMCPPSRLRSTP